MLKSGEERIREHKFHIFLTLAAHETISTNRKQIKHYRNTDVLSRRGLKAVVFAYSGLYGNKGTGQRLRKKS